MGESWSCCIGGTTPRQTVGEVKKDFAELFESAVREFGRPTTQEGARALICCLLDRKLTGQASAAAQLGFDVKEFSKWLNRSPNGYDTAIGDKLIRQATIAADDAQPMRCINITVQIRGEVAGVVCLPEQSFAQELRAKIEEQFSDSLRDCRIQYLQAGEYVLDLTQKLHICFLNAAPIVKTFLVYDRKE